MAGKKKTAEPKRAMWSPILLVRVYRLARLGMCDSDICKELGVSRQTFHRWIREKPELAEAMRMAEKERSEGETLPEWIYRQISPELREVWDQVRAWHREENGVLKIEMLLADKGVRVRQQLFLHALCVCRFSASHALRMVNVSKREFDQWVSSDPCFSELVQEVEWHKGNYFERQLVKLVQEGNPQAVIFANKTLNSTRGYGARMKMDVQHSGAVLHGVMDLGDLLPYLSADTRLQVLEAIRRREKEKASRELAPVEVLSHTIAEGLPAPAGK